MSARTRVGLLLTLTASAAAFCIQVAAQQAATNPAGARPQLQALAAAEAQAKGLTPAQAMPVDPSITVGRFPNGLRYYIRTNKLPEKRAELRLAVNAGSVLEDDDQLGLAHMVEHMAFNGTAHFQKQEIVSFMESIGMRFGPSLNAFTSFDETVYMLTVPTDKPEVMQKAFLILEDWAHNLSFDPAEIDKERGVIVEEWRLGRGASARMRDAQFPILFKGSRYADRLPIGKKESIETFKHDALKRFYRDWYRPDLMAVVAVGDFDKAAVEGLLEKHFASLPAVKVPRLRPTYNVPDHPDTLYSVASDREATSTQVSVYTMLPLVEPGTVGVYRQQITQRLAAGMLSRRLVDMTQQPTSPFVMAAAGRSALVRSKEAAILNAIPKEGAAGPALEAVLTEAARAGRFGFTASEFDRQKRETLRNYERYFDERDRHESAQLANECVRNFTQKETLPGAALEYGLHQRFLPEISLDEVNRIAGAWTGEANRVVLVSAPQKPGVTVPDEANLAALVRGVADKPITAYVDTVGTAALVERIPEPGAVVKTGRQELAGLTEWELSNGVKVALKPTDFKQDEIVFRAFSPGGTSLASDADFIPASTAAQVMSITGVGKFSAIDLRKVLAGKIATVRPVVGETEEGLMGGGSPKDLETLFQLIYLTFTQPRADAGAFAAHTAQGRAVLANQQANPAWVFSEALQSALSQNHPRARLMTPALIDEMNMEKSMAFYKDRFADASDFTFVFVGSFDLAAMRPLVERYLGSLPSLRRHETWKDVGIRPPTGVVEKVVRKGIEPKSQAAIVYTGPFQYDQAHRIAIRAVGSVLDTRLRERLREDLGGTYGVSASPNYTKVPQERFTFQISFGCDPKRTDDLVKAAFTIVDALRADGPTEKEVSDTREAFLRDYETNLKQNSYVMSQIYLRYQTGEDVNEFFRLADYYRKVDAATIKEAARMYLDPGNYVKVTLFPETPPAAEK